MSRSSNGVRVFIGGLSEDIKKEDIEGEFERFGKVSNVWVAFNPPGFGFMEFETVEEAETACDHMNGTNFLGCKLRVELSRSQSRGRGGRGGGRGGGGRGGGGRFGGRDDGYGGGRFKDSRGFRGGGGGGYGGRDSGGYGGGGGGGFGGRRDSGGRGGGGGGGRSRFSGDYNGDSRNDRYRSRSPNARSD